ncbi:MAG: SusC/RagA family TonB-linked outer membrane protein [Mangrovibacterium sp.]
MMRLTFLFVFTGLMQVSANLYSQSTKLSLAMQNSRLEDILRAIEQQSEYRFAYSAEYIDLNRHMNVDFVSKPITEVLDVLFKGTGVKYNIESRHIMLYVENQMNVQNRMVQQQSISGRVTDSSGTPLPGVTVVVKGTTRGTITDANGNYSLPDISADAVLVFSFVGMRTQEISVVGKTGINLIMQEETVGIEEVIAVGYGTQKKANLTGAVVTVDAEDLVTQSVTSAAQAIQGRAPGVQVIRNSGAPGASATIKMRGIGTFGNASPLVLIDGIEGDINLISPNEIETINILKDASSSAIYGTKAANGVILITTRKGASGKGKIQYNVSYGVNQAMRVPRVLNAKEFATLQNEALINNNLAPYYTNEEIDNMGEGTNWVDEILQTGYRQSHNLMFSGGNEAIRYALNGDFLDEKGIQINTWYKRYNVRLNLDADVNKWLTIGLNSFVSHSKVNLNNNYSEYDLIMYAAQYTPTISPKVGGITGYRRA